MVQLEASLQLLQFIEQLPPIKHENPLLRSLRLVCVCGIRRAKHATVLFQNITLDSFSFHPLMDTHQG